MFLSVYNWIGLFTSWPVLFISCFLVLFLSMNIFFFSVYTMLYGLPNLLRRKSGEHNTKTKRDEGYPYGGMSSWSPTCHMLKPTLSGQRDSYSPFWSFLFKVKTVGSLIFMLLAVITGVLYVFDYPTLVELIRMLLGIKVEPTIWDKIKEGPPMWVMQWFKFFSGLWAGFYWLTHHQVFIDLLSYIASCFGLGSDTISTVISHLPIESAKVFVSNHPVAAGCGVVVAAVGAGILYFFFSGGG